MTSHADPGSTDDARPSDHGYLLFERLRWGSGTVTCPHCDAVGRSYFLRPANGHSRTTRTGSSTVRRVWKCGNCRRQFSVLTGTIFQGTRIELGVWVLVIGDLISAEAFSTAAIAERHGIDSATARHMVERLIAAGVSGNPQV